MSNALTKVFLVLLLLKLSTNSNASKAARNLAFSLSYMNLTYGEKDIFSEFKYKFYNEKRKVKIVIEFKVKENVTSYDLHSSIDLLRGDDSRLNLMKVPVNGCQLGKLGTIANSMLGVFFRELRRISNLPLRCPLYANKLYYLRNYTINPDSFPPITIPMQWILTIQIFQKKNYVGTLYFHGKFYIV